MLELLECQVPFDYYRSYVHSEPGVVAADPVLSMGQIELFGI